MWADFGTQPYEWAGRASNAIRLSVRMRAASNAIRSLARRTAAQRTFRFRRLVTREPSRGKGVRFGDQDTREKEKKWIPLRVVEKPTKRRALSSSRRQCRFIFATRRDSRTDCAACPTTSCCGRSSRGSTRTTRTRSWNLAGAPEVTPSIGLSRIFREWVENWFQTVFPLLTRVRVWNPRSRSNNILRQCQGALSSTLLFSPFLSPPFLFFFFLDRMKRIFQFLPHPLSKILEILQRVSCFYSYTLHG